MAIDLWFPLAIYYEDLPDSASHNVVLRERIEELHRLSGEQTTSENSSWTGDVHDVDRLQDDPVFDWLIQQLGEHALNYLKALGHDIERTDVYVQRAWAIIAH